MPEKKWKVVITGNFQEQLDHLSSEDAKVVMEELDRLARNPYRGTPIFLGFFGWRWVWVKIMFLVHEFKKIING